MNSQNTYNDTITEQTGIAVFICGDAKSVELANNISKKFSFAHYHVVRDIAKAKTLMEEVDHNISWPRVVFACDLDILEEVYKDKLLYDKLLLVENGISWLEVWEYFFSNYFGQLKINKKCLATLTVDSSSQDYHLEQLTACLRAVV